MVTGTGLAQGYYLLGILIMHHPSRPVKYFACIHMMENHVPRLAALAPSRVRLWGKMKSALLVSATTMLLILLKRNFKKLEIDPIIGVCSFSRCTNKEV